MEPKVFQKLDETIQEMDNLYQPDQSLLSYIDIQAAIETTREANDIVIPALQTSVNEFAADELQMLAAKTNNQRLATQTKMRERREELIKKVELQLAKSAWKAEEKNSKQQNEAYHHELMRAHEDVISQYHTVLQALNITMRLQALTTKPGRYRIEFNYKTYIILFEYDDVADTFELREMTPKLSTFEQIKQFVQRTNDTKSALCVWRNFCSTLSESKLDPSAL